MFLRSLIYAVFVIADSSVPVIRHFSGGFVGFFYTRQQEVAKNPCKRSYLYVV